MQALGFIEVVGKVAAIEAADTCLKSANVKLVGCEVIKGALITIEVEGDVGAVKSAIDAAKARDIVQDKLVSTLVIPRPAKGISAMVELESTKQAVYKSKTVDIENEEEEFSNKVENNEEVIESNGTNNKENLISDEMVNEDIFISEKIKNEDNVKDAIEEEKINTVIDIDIIKSGEVKSKIGNSNDNNNTDNQLVEEDKQIEDKKEFTCNLCHDPMCLRKRGQPKNLCMYYKDKIESVGGDTSYDVK